MIPGCRVFFEFLKFCLVDGTETRSMNDPYHNHRLENGSYIYRSVLKLYMHPSVFLCPIKHYTLTPLIISNGACIALKKPEDKAFSRSKTNFATVKNLNKQDR